MPGVFRGHSVSGWIKVEKDLETDIRVQRIVKRISVNAVTQERTPGNASVTVVIGALTRLWMFADSHARDDDTLDMTADELDEWLGVPGFAAALPEDWLAILPDGRLELPGFQEHNGVEAKSRALTQKRVERHRKKNVKRNGVTPALPDQTRPDQKRQDQKKRGSGGDSKSPITHPIGLDAAAWQRWIEYRKASGKPLKPASLQAAVDEFVKHGTDQAAVVQQSIAHGWQGLFALKTNGSKPQPKFVAPPDDPPPELRRA